MRLSFALLALATAPSLAFGQFAINWYSIDGGGGTSSGGGFTLTGVIGQPDAGPTMSGGQFQLSGGFLPAFTQFQCGPADLGSQGGIAGPDGVLNNNDFIVFINYFFNQDPRADFGRQGGVPPGDGQFNNNDFIVFIDRFFAGCS